MNKLQPKEYRIMLNSKIAGTRYSLPEARRLRDWLDKKYGKYVHRIMLVKHIGTPFEEGMLAR